MNRASSWRNRLFFDRKHTLTSVEFSFHYIHVLKASCNNVGLVASWPYESLLCGSQAKKIVDAALSGRPKAQVARSFGVGISTLKRYTSKAQKGEG